MADILHVNVIHKDGAPGDGADKKGKEGSIAKT
jgi:hypothetical protein